MAHATNGIPLDLISGPVVTTNCIGASNWKPWVMQIVITASGQVGRMLPILRFDFTNITVTRVESRCRRSSIGHRGIWLEGQSIIRRLILLISFRPYWKPQEVNILSNGKESPHYHFRELAYYQPGVQMIQVTLGHCSLNTREAEQSEKGIGSWSPLVVSHGNYMIFRRIELSPAIW